MNIKFKMPKFRRTLTNKSMWKELLLTFLGTTISIVLTFGTAHLLDIRQRNRDRKMSALMVTGNVERFARVLDGLADDLTQRDTISAWLLGLSLDSLERIPHDQMVEAINAVITIPQLSHDRTAENIFSNSIETWKNMGNFNFIDRVGQCFAEINDCENQYNEFVLGAARHVEWIKRHAKDFPGSDICMKCMQDNEFRDNIGEIHGWICYLRFMAASFRYSNLKSMDLIGVTEEEVIRFADSRDDTTASNSSEPLYQSFITPKLKFDSLGTMPGLIDRVVY
ncbi:MAG: hypothetical protein IKN11_10325 [Bacteroidales bacterium]|nr:hypothetical protein [Bacteroidales bacterium]